PARWAARRVEDVRFARQHLLPWIGRRLTGRSSGDGRAGAQFDAALGRAFWVTPEEKGWAAPVATWRQVESGEREGRDASGS
ncbi:SGNH/GDSL hydrolase family protein, partial [Streptomyces sp. SID9727]|nr:SGNH/GDSL hydrolase family protein [Streptomyces sp. SID9727]